MNRASAEHAKRTSDLKKARKKVERRLRATVDPETYQRLVNKLYFFSL